MKEDEAEPKNAKHNVVEKENHRRDPSATWRNPGEFIERYEDYIEGVSIVINALMQLILHAIQTYV